VCARIIEKILGNGAEVLRRNYIADGEVVDDDNNFEESAANPMHQRNQQQQRAASSRRIARTRSEYSTRAKPVPTGVENELADLFWKQPDLQIFSHPQSWEGGDASTP